MKKTYVTATANRDKFSEIIIEDCDSFRVIRGK